MGSHQFADQTVASTTAAAVVVSALVDNFTAPADRVPSSQSPIVCPESGSCYPSAEIRVFLTLLLIMFIVVSLFGNVLLCGIVYRRSAMRSGINLLLANVAMADVLMSVLHFPLVLVVLNLRGWSFGDGLCKVNGFLFTLLNAEKVIVLLMISVDRYLIIVKRKDTLTQYKAKVSIIGSWLFALFISILPVLGWGRYDFHRGDIQCVVQDEQISNMASLRKSYVIFATTVLVFFPAFAMFFIYNRIFRTVRRNGFRVQNHPPVIPTAMHKKGKYFIDYSYKTRTSTTILLLSIYFLACILPLAIVNVYLASRGLHSVSVRTHLGVLVFSYCHSPFSPVLYYWRIKKFRESFIDFWSQILVVPQCGPLYLRRERRIRPHVLYQVEQSDGKIAVIG